MHLELELLIGSNIVVMCIISYFLGIHHRGRYFNSTTEIDVVVAQVVGIYLNLFLTEGSTIMSYQIMNR